MRKFILYTIVIIEIYKGRGIDYAQDEPQAYYYDNEYQSIEVTTPEANIEEQKVDREIKKLVDAFYSPYIFQNPLSE